MRRYRFGVAAVAVAAAAIVLPASAPAAATGSARASVAVGPGVTLDSGTVTIAGHKPERVHILHVNLRYRHTALVAASPGNGIGAPRATVQQLGSGTNVLAGVNGDFFDPDLPDAFPNNGIVESGQLVKTPATGWQANLSVSASGRAQIGPVTFTGSVTRPAQVLGPPAATHPISSVNYPRDAWGGRITLIDHDLYPGATFRSPCTVVSGTADSGDAATVTLVSTTAVVPRPAAGGFALVACGHGEAPTWLAGQLSPGDTIDLTTGFAGGTPTMLVSGGAQLVRHGRAYADPTGRSSPEAEPVTFACVSADGLSVLLGTIDGRSSRSRGVTYVALRIYLLHLHCYDGMAFDGGGSTTMVVRQRGRSAVSVLNRPSDGKPRKIADAVLVVTR